MSDPPAPSDGYDRYIESMRCEGQLDEGRDQHIVKVTFRDFVPPNHMRDLIRHAVSEFGLGVVEECEWRDPEGGITLTIYPEQDPNG